MIAAEQGHLDACHLLCDKGANIQDEDYEGTTALMYAAMGGHTEVARLLLDRGATIGAEDAVNALHYACMKGKFEMVRLLIERGADVNGMGPKNPKKTSALIVTAMYCRQKALLSDEPSEHLKMEPAEEHLKIAVLLHACGAELDHLGAQRATALIVASMNQAEGMAILLCQLGASMDLQDTVGCTALYCATYSENLMIVMYLCMNGANRQLKGRGPYEDIARTPLEYAQKVLKGHVITTYLSSFPALEDAATSKGSN